MYEVNGQRITSYMKAIESAKAAGVEVFEVREDGSKHRRWAPAPPVSVKKIRRYHNQKAAYEAQQRMNGKA